MRLWCEKRRCFCHLPSASCFGSSGATFLLQCQATCSIPFLLHGLFLRPCYHPSWTQELGFSFEAQQPVFPRGQTFACSNSSKRLGIPQCKFPEAKKNPWTNPCPPPLAPPLYNLHPQATWIRISTLWYVAFVFLGGLFP